MWGFLTERDELLDRAEQEAHIVLGETPGPTQSWGALVAQCRVAQIRGDREGASRCYHELLSNHYGRTGQKEYTLGMAATTAGMYREARDHFSRSWAYLETSGLVPDLVDAGYHYGKFLVEQGANEDLQLAQAVTKTALGAANRYGMALWAEKLESLQREIESFDAPQIYPEGLSEREVEVLHLVADGMTDREIADQLFISPKTVANHVAHIRGKTGCRNRVAIGRYARDNLATEQ